MAGIEPARLLAATLRSHVAARAASQGTARPAGPGAAPSMGGTVAQRVQAIPADDPDRRRKAFQVFLESLFLREFGAGLVHDPGFPHMVQAVQQQMESDVGLRRASQALGDLLLAGKVKA